MPAGRPARHTARSSRSAAAPCSRSIISTSRRRPDPVLVGVPKEIKTHEYRVGMIPGSARELGVRGHRVIVETGAGAGIGFDDDAYRRAGATVAASAAELFAAAELIVKVKEPQPGEI